MPHVMFRSDRKTYGTWTSLQYMVITWTTYYGKDFTRIVLELIGSELVTNAIYEFHSQGKCIEIHVGYDKETRGINRCGDE